MDDPKILICSSKFPGTRERTFSKYIENLGKCPQKCSPALGHAVVRETNLTRKFIHSCLNEFQLSVVYKEV